MRRISLLLVLCLVAFGAARAQSAKLSAREIEVPYEKFVLDNGLTVIVHEDHKAPIVAVNLWYHVGSKNEKPGKTGFAHLFEHLMFNGSENLKADFINTLEQYGVTEFNGTTWFDRTNYFENVPKNALDAVLWLESDRMGHFAGAITQEVLDEQRGVVQNEKREGENQPYGRVWDLILPSIYPASHPYSWETIGSMDDLNAASLEDVKEWFATYYGPNNAVLVLAGDITPAEARQKAELYFGDIPPGPPIAKHDVWIAKRTGTQRQILQDRVPQARVYKVWNTPQWGSREAAHLDLVADVLASGKTSRLYKRLVYDEQIATSVVVDNSTFEIGGMFEVQATARPGVPLERVEQAVDEELARLLRDGPTADEVERARTGYVAAFVRSLEGIGGFGGKSDLLATNQVYGGDPEHYKEYLGWIESATAAELHRTAQAWLSDGVYVMEVHPVPELAAAAQGADRSKVPPVGEPPVAQFPKLERATLSNGMTIVLAERHDVPLVEMQLLVDAGYAADQFASPGTAQLAVGMLDEGTKTRSALEISEALESLGTQLSTGSNLDLSYVNLSTLKANLGPSLDLFADVVLNPSFPETDFERLRQQQLARIQQEKATPFQMALRIVPTLLYGKEHAYGVPLTGSGYEAAVQSLGREELVKFHQTWFRPNNATLIVVGDVTMAEVKPELERRFGAWRKGDVPEKNIGTVRHQPRPVVYLLDRPGSQQSIITAGHVAPPKANPQEIAIETMNNVLGGQFTARINLNLREDKHWSYGSYSYLVSTAGQRPFLVLAPVQTDKTREAILEIRKEFTDILSARPITADELALAKNQQTLTLPGQWETNSAVLGSIGSLVRFDLPDDYYATYPEKVRAQTLAHVAAAAREVVRPDNLVWMIVGDRSKIEAGIRELNLGELHIIDADGNPAGSAQGSN